MTTHGAELKSSGRFVTAAVSAGILGGNDVNLVNSAVIAKEKSCEVRIKQKRESEKELDVTKINLYYNCLYIASVE